MKIDVISDSICPWCFIGKRRLERALAERSSVTFDLRWRPFQLDPALPKEGVERKSYLKAKFGDTPQAKLIAAAIRDAGEQEGIHFAFDRIERTPNTLDSHRLIRWAGSAGVQGAVVEALFTRYFEQGHDIGQRDILIDIATKAGMDEEIVAGLLDSDSDLELVEREDSLARKMGIGGVPSYLFGGRYLIQGAQDPETILQVIDRVLLENKHIAELGADAAE